MSSVDDEAATACCMSATFWRPLRHLRPVYGCRLRARFLLSNDGVRGCRPRQLLAFVSRDHAFASAAHCDVWFTTRCGSTGAKVRRTPISFERTSRANALERPFARDRGPVRTAADRRCSRRARSATPTLVVFRCRRDQAPGVRRSTSQLRCARARDRPAAEASIARARGRHQMC